MNAPRTKYHPSILEVVSLHRDAAAVKRYHTKRTHRGQTVGEHSFDMLTLLILVHPECRKELILACVYHDLPEVVTGDIPAPIKRSDPELGKRLDKIERGVAHLYKDFHLTEEEICLLKWADRMELVLWCLEEYMLGNQYVEDTIRRGLGWILDSGVPTCAVTLTGYVCATVTRLGMKASEGEELETTR